jgi:hypothetical protein
MILDFLLHMANCAVLEDHAAHSPDSSAVIGQKSLQHLQTAHCKLPLKIHGPAKTL